MTQLCEQVINNGAELPESRQCSGTTSACKGRRRLCLLATPAPESLRMGADLRVASYQVNCGRCPQAARIPAAHDDDFFYCSFRNKTLLTAIYLFGLGIRHLSNMHKCRDMGH